MNTIMAAALRLRRRRQAPARVWIQFLGYLASLVDVLPDCWLHMRPLQLHLLRHYSPSRDLLTRLVPIPPPIRLHLVRWSRRGYLSSRNPLRVAQPSIYTVTTDASLLGWGGHCLGNTAFGDWPRADTLSHINVLEFRAVLLSLRSFLPLLRRRTVLIRTDNVTVAAYINKQGGTHSTRLNALAALLWKWCRREGIFPIVSHIPGQDNLITDFLSRSRVLPSEWTLHPTVMDQIVRTFGPLQVELLQGSGPSSLEDRRVLLPVEGVPGLCLPADLPHPAHTAEESGGSSAGGANSTLVAEEELVPQTDRPTSGSPEDPAPSP